MHLCVSICTVFFSELAGLVSREEAHEDLVLDEDAPDHTHSGAEETDREDERDTDSHATTTRTAAAAASALGSTRSSRGLDSIAETVGTHAAKAVTAAAGVQPILDTVSVSEVISDGPADGLHVLSPLHHSLLPSSGGSDSDAAGIALAIGSRQMVHLTSPPAHLNTVDSDSIPALAVGSSTMVNTSSAALSARSHHSNLSWQPIHSATQSVQSSWSSSSSPTATSGQLVHTSPPRLTLTIHDTTEVKQLANAPGGGGVTSSSSSVSARLHNAMAHGNNHSATAAGTGSGSGSSPRAPAMAPAASFPPYTLGQPSPTKHRTSSAANIMSPFNFGSSSHLGAPSAMGLTSPTANAHASASAPPTRRSISMSGAPPNMSPTSGGGGLSSSGNLLDSVNPAPSAATSSRTKRVVSVHGASSFSFSKFRFISFLFF